MTESDIIARAKQYMDALASGINPITGVPLDPGECAADERMKRCFLYTSKVLSEAYDRKIREEYRTVRRNASDFFLTQEELAGFEYSDEPIGVTKIKDRLNVLRNEQNVKPLKVTSITAFLMGSGLLEMRENEKIPTDAGRAIGITVTERTDMYSGAVRKYVVYSREAQQFIIDNIDALCAINKNSAQRKAIIGGK